MSNVDKNRRKDIQSEYALDDYIISDIYGCNNK